MQSAAPFYTCPNEGCYFYVATGVAKGKDPPPAFGPLEATLRAIVRDCTAYEKSSRLTNYWRPVIIGIRNRLQPFTRAADEAMIQRGARAVAAAESWGWGSRNTPNGNTVEEQEAWCMEMSRKVLAAALGEQK